MKDFLDRFFNRFLTDFDNEIDCVIFCNCLYQVIIKCIDTNYLISKAGIGRDKVIPLYGRDGDQKDPREKPIPPRPRGQRPEPESTGGGPGQFGNLFNTGGFQMSFGIGNT